MTNQITLLIAEIAKFLTDHNWSCVTAESCTGGGLAYALTSLAGSSKWFERGFVTYSNQAKQDLLGVNALTLEKFGAVSGETAQEMAAGALKNSQSQISVAITGIAGPDGGSQNKPVGTVWIATATSHQIEAHAFLFEGDRHSIREQSIVQAMNLILAVMLESFAGTDTKNQ